MGGEEMIKGERTDWEEEEGEEEEEVGGGDLRQWYWYITISALTPELGLWIRKEDELRCRKFGGKLERLVEVTVEVLAVGEVLWAGGFHNYWGG